jgi:hypothetical protein
MKLMKKQYINNNKELKTQKDNDKITIIMDRI